MVLEEVALEVTDVDTNGVRLGVDLIINSDKQLQVWGVVDGLLMHRAGLVKNDIIHSINGMPITEFGHIPEAVAKHGDRMCVIVLRDRAVAEQFADKVLNSEDGLMISTQLGTPLCDKCAGCGCDILEDKGFVRFHCVDCEMTDFCVKCHTAGLHNTNIASAHKRRQQRKRRHRRQSSKDHTDDNQHHVEAKETVTTDDDDDDFEIDIHNDGGDGGGDSAVRSTFWRLDNLHHKAHYVCEEDAGPVSLRLQVWGAVPAHTLNNALLTYACRPLFGVRTSLMQATTTTTTTTHRPPPHKVVARSNASSSSSLSAAAAMLPPPLTRGKSIRLIDVHDEYVWTSYGMVRAQSLSLATGLSSLFPPGTFVGLCGHNRIEWLVADFACVFSEFVSVGLHTSWPIDDLSYVLSNADVALVVCDAHLLHKFFDAVVHPSYANTKLRVLVCMDEVVPENVAARGRRIKSSCSEIINDHDDDSDRRIWIVTLAEVMRFGDEKKALKPPHSGVTTETGLTTAEVTFRDLELPDDDYKNNNNNNNDNDSSANKSKSNGGCMAPNCTNYAVHNARYSLISERVRVNGPPGYCDSCYNSRDDVRAIVAHRTRVREYLSTHSDEVVDPLFSLVYSSGSSGVPKGCAITARSWNNSVAGPETIRYMSPNVVLSYAALGHAMDRMMIWQTMTSGGRVGFVSRDYDLNELLECTRALRPTLFVAMPDLWNQVYSMYDRMLATTIHTHAPDKQHTTNAELYRLRDAVLQHVRDLFGGRVAVVGTGGAKISDTCLNFLRLCLKCPVTNAYGTTEASGICSNGKLHGDVKLRLIDVPVNGGGYFQTDIPYPRGEIAVKTSSTIVGYFRNEAATRETFVDGWCMTGDIGEMEPGDYLRIIDRRRNFIELYHRGRSVWIAPQSLQAKYFQSACVKHIFLHGERTMPFLVAVVVPDDDLIATQCRLLDGGGDDDDDDDDDRVKMIDWTCVRDRVLQDLVQIGRRLSLKSYEIPSGVVIAREQWSPSNGFLTATGKQVRPRILEQYRHAIDLECARIQTAAADEKKDCEGDDDNSDDDDDDAHDNDKQVMATPSAVALVSSQSVMMDMDEVTSMLQACCCDEVKNRQPSPPPLIMSQSYSQRVHGDSRLMFLFYRRVLAAIHTSPHMHSFEPSYAFIVHQRLADVITSFRFSMIKDFGDDWTLRTESDDMLIKRLDADTYLPAELEEAVHTALHTSASLSLSSSSSAATAAASPSGLTPPTLARQHSYPFNDDDDGGDDVDGARNKERMYAMTREVLSDTSRTIMLVGMSHTWQLNVLYQLLTTHTDGVKFICVMVMNQSAAAAENNYETLERRFVARGWTSVLSPDRVRVVTMNGSHSKNSGTGGGGDGDDDDDGGDVAEYNELSHTVTLVYHLHEHVDMACTYAELYQHNVAALHWSIRLALSSRPVKPIVLVSSTLVFEGRGVRRLSKMHPDTPNLLVPFDAQEELGAGARVASMLSASGYAQSKWVCEQLARRCSRKYHMPLLVYRKGWFIDDDDGVVDVHGGGGHMSIKSLGRLCGALGVYPLAPSDREWFVDCTRSSVFAEQLVRPSVDFAPWQDTLHASMVPEVTYHVLETTMAEDEYVTIEHFIHHQQQQLVGVSYREWCTRLLTAPLKTIQGECVSWWRYIHHSRYPNVGPSVSSPPPSSSS